MKKISRILGFGIVFPLIYGFISAQQPAFIPANESEALYLTSQRRIIPNKYLFLKVDFDALKTFLNQAPHENQMSGGMLFKYPMPDGTTQDFEIWQYDMMEPGLANQLPGIKTFLGKGKTDPYAVIRLDYTYQGFHGYILSPFGTAAIDPYAFGNTTYYISYFKDDLPNIHAPFFECGVNESVSVENDDDFPEVKSLLPLGTQRRNYRLALACTGEYATYHGGTVSSVASAMTTAMNRVNGVYEKDLAVRMNLVSNNNSLIFLNAATDPYTNNDGAAMLGQNQTTVTNVIGSANYDIGHVFSTGGGGIASLASLCDNSVKAQGVTGLPAPTGDPFYIDYVAHEMGHQFNGGHTFNSTAGSCNGNRSANDAYEPGSGSTIMAYAGICSPDNIQNNSDDYFHARSYRTIYTEIVTNEASCPTTTNTGNNPPTVNAGNGGKYVPISTPFKLTAIGNDPDGNALTYCWEQYDLGNSIPLATNPTSGTPPLFRSFKPDTSATRYFPRLQLVVNNTNDNREKLPTYTRVMTFRCTVRDNVPNGGGISFDTVGYNFTASAGPFLVTAPNNSSAFWISNTTETVTWDVANTNVSPVSCSLVNIRLSVDGGYTYPYLLAANTPNDGSQTITVPNIGTTITTCRVMVEAVNNIFYDISNANFTISPSAPQAPVAAFTANDLDICQGQFVNFTDQSTNGPTSWQWNFGGGGNPATSTVQNPNNILFNTPGTYTVTLTVSNVSGSSTSTQTIVVNPLPTASFTTTPANNSLSNGSATATPTSGTPPFSYQWFSNPVQTTQTATNLPAGTVGFTITDDNGCSRNYNVTIPDNTSVETASWINSIIIYPNPATESVQVRLGDIVFADKIQISLFNNLGQAVYSMVMPFEPVLTIPVQEFASGWYVLKIEAMDGAKQMPLIIRK